MATIIQTPAELQEEEDERQKRLAKDRGKIPSESTPAGKVYRRRGHPGFYDPKYCELVVRDMSQGYSLGGFAGSIPVSRGTLIVWMNKYPEFDEAVQLGKAARIRQWETMAIKAAQTQEGGNPAIIKFGLMNAGIDDWNELTKTVTVTETGDTGAKDAISAREIIACEITRIVARIESASGPREAD